MSRGGWAALPRGATGLSAVCDCGISGSYSFTIFVCFLTNERYKMYQTGFSFDCLGHGPGVGLGGTTGVSGVIFFRNSTRFGVLSYPHE